MAKYNYQKIDFAAQQIIVKNCKVTFPVNILNLIEQFKNVELMTFSEFDNDEKNPGFLANTISSDAFTMKVGDNEYIIVYNDNTFLKSVQRIRFSLSHELGHINLDHFEFGETLLAREHFGINSKQYRIFEKEADLFANQLLAPFYIIPDNWEKNHVADVFDISSSSASITCDARHSFHWITPKTEFKEAFTKATFSPKNYLFDSQARNESDYNIMQQIAFGTYYHFCPVCKSFEINIKSQLKYCAICGSDNLKIIPRNKYLQFHETDEQKIKFFPRGENNMQYLTLKLDNEGRLDQPCPRCGNEKPTHNFCSVCGIDIINRCNNINPFSGCDDAQPLQGHERYCPHCGHASTFLQNGLLPAWDDIPEFHEDKFNASRFNDLPFQ